MKVCARPVGGKVVLSCERPAVDPALLAFAALVPSGCVCGEVDPEDRPCLPCDAVDVLEAATVKP